MSEIITFLGGSKIVILLTLNICIVCHFVFVVFKIDVQTDGKWCYIVFWVVGKATTRWSLLKERLLEVCPSCIPAASEIYYYKPEFQQPRSPDIFLLKFWCSYDRKGLLHGKHIFSQRRN